jgi:hypothetical protein
MLVWDECGFQKKCAETHHAKLVFCIRWDLWVSLCIALRPTRNTSMHYFSFSFGTGSDFTKSVTGHVTLNLHFCIWYGFQKKHDGTCYTELAFFASGGIYRSRRALRCVRGAKPRRTIFHARVVPIRIPQKARRDTLRRTCVFASDRICRSRSALWNVRVQNIDALFFMLGSD